MEEKIVNLIKELKNDVEKFNLEAEKYASKATKVNLIIYQLEDILQNKEG